jgi:indolepyruvate ferredoxin oxidoreductase, beta subunit
MKKDIILAGVGGQGILSIAAVIGQVALANNMFIKQSEVHGMSQRGGAVMSHLRISSEPIDSDLIPFGMAHLILSVEPMESLRYLPYLSSSGWLITNSQPFLNINNYPDTNALYESIKSVSRSFLIDADKLATEAGSVKASNIATLGAAIPFLQLPIETFEEGIKTVFFSKSKDIIALNIKALHLGYEKTAQLV